MLFDDDLLHDDDLVDAESGNIFFASDEDEASVDSGKVVSPSATYDLLGHEEIEKQLLFMLEQNRFPHGLIFSGMEGIGKSVMAYRLARYLLAKGGVEEDDNNFALFGDSAPKASPTSLFVSSDDPVSALIESQGHPDMRVYARPFDEENGVYKESIPVEDIRKIAPFLRNTASVSGGWRIVILDDADTMTRSSQNSLLKILEEPPEKSLLILVAHRAGALLPTIYSRCVHIPFAPLADSVIAERIKNRCTPEEMDFILSMAEGALGAAYEYTETENAEIVFQAIRLLNGGKTFRWTDIQNFAEVFGVKGNETAQRIFRETMLWVAMSLVRGRLKGFEGLQTLPLGKRIKIYDDLRAHFSQCKIGNLDKRFLILGAYMVFES